MLSCEFLAILAAGIQKMSIQKTLSPEETNTLVEAESLDENLDKSLKSFASCYSQSPLQLCLRISISLNPCDLICISSNLRHLLLISCKSHNLFFISIGSCTLQRRKEENLIENHVWLRNPYSNLKSENSQEYAQKP